jgi:hypothetical protein
MLRLVDRHGIRDCASGYFSSACSGFTSVGPAELHVPGVHCGPSNQPPEIGVALRPMAVGLDELTAITLNRRKAFD